MSGFNIDGGRSYPHLPSIKNGTAFANTSQNDYLVNVGQIAAGAASVPPFMFDTQYLAWGGVNQLLSLPLSIVPGCLLTLGRSIEVAAQIVGQPGQIEFLVSDVEPNPLTLAQLLANMIADTDRAPVAVANDATSFKVVQYTCRTRYVVARLRNLGAGNTTSWYISQAARQD